MRRRNYIWLPALLTAGLLLAACGRTPETTPAASEPAAAPAEPAVAVAPTGTAPAATAMTATEPAQTEPAAVQPEAAEPAAAAPADWTQTVTQEGDYWVLGNPAAPVRMIDYSDFL